MTDLRRTPLRRLLLLSALMGGASLVEDTATGNPVVFSTDVAKPLVSLIANFLPIQSSGTPSPDNILPITGWTGLNVGHAEGKNLLPDNAVEYGSYGTDGGKIQDDNNKYRRLSIDLPAGNYVFSTDTENCYIIRLLVNNTVVGTGGATQSKVFTLTESANVKIAWRNTDTSAITATLHNQIELGNSATAYEPYKYSAYYPVTFPSTIYGGYVDMVTGEVWGTHKSITKNTANMDNSEDYPGWRNTASRADFGKINKQVNECKGNIFELTNYAILVNNNNADPGTLMLNKEFFNKTQSEWQALALDVQIVYPLVSPVLITTLTPQQINAIKGNNTVWSDGNGDCEVTFLKKG